MIKPGCCIVIVIVFPYSGFCRLIAESSCSIQIKQPERYINCPDLFEMIFIFKYFRKKRFSFVMCLKCLFRFFFWFHKRNDVIRTITVFKLFRHDHWIVTIRTHRWSCCLFGQYFSSTGRTVPHCHIWLLIWLPLFRFKPFPFFGLIFFYRILLFCQFIQFFQRIRTSAKFAFHLLFFTVKRKSSRTVWTFVV